jgi:hypothetical protein
MNASAIRPTDRPAQRSDVVVAWTVVLLTSYLPDALWQGWVGAIPAWLFWVKAGGLFSMIVAGLKWKWSHSLRPFFILLLILVGGRRVLEHLGMTLTFVAEGGQSRLLLRLAQLESSRLLLAAVMIVAALVMGKRRQDLFLAKGDLTRWGRPGIVLALSIMVLTFLFFDFRLPPTGTLHTALGLIPAALLFAALAAFDEEARSRATLLPYLYEVVGKNHSIMMTAFVFGMGHYFGGAPSGIVGVMIAGALGLLWATMMLETKGVFLPWLSHFLTNVPTFLMWTFGPINP